MAGKEPEVAPIPAVHQRLTNVIKHKLHLFAVGDDQIQAAALAATKSLFDSGLHPIQTALSQEDEGFSNIKRFVKSITNDINSQPRETRSQNKSRMAEQQEDTDSLHPKLNGLLVAANKLQPTPLKELHTTNMDVDQVWSQLELRAKSVCDLVDIFFEGEYPDPDALAGDEEAGDKMEVDEEDEEDSEEDETSDDEDDEEEESDSESDPQQDLGDYIMPLASERPRPSRVSTSSFSVASRALTNGKELSNKGTDSVRAKRDGPRHPTLDDDFFSISEFNREIESAEAKTSSKGRLKASKNDDSDEDDDNESIDLFADVGDAFEEDDGENDSDEDGTADGDISYPLMYSDFFDKPSTASGAPSRSSTTHDRNVVEMKIISSSTSKSSKVRFHEEVKVKLIKPKRKRYSLMDIEEEDEDEDEKGDELPPFDEGWDEEGVDNSDEEGTEEGEEYEDQEEGEPDKGEEESETDGFDAIERAKDDLFAEDESLPTNLSAHAQRQLALKEQIAALEQENIAPKEWMLQGEATSRSRPLNSLLEEDLEFEHRQRVVPVMTEEKIKGVEDIIRARIIEGRYDDVVRRRAFDDKPFLPSRYFELQDTKSAQSLAQIYEDEYIASSSNAGSKFGGGVGPAIDDRDGKLKKEHDELEALWENISGKLDALCNAHFTPKTARGVISTISNVSSTTLESALPTAKNAASLLAPEEVFSTKVPGVIASKVEMTPSEKQAERMKRRKKRMKMAKVLDGKKTAGVSVHVNGRVSNDQVERGEKNKKGNKGKMRLEKEEKANALKAVVKSGKGVTVVGKGSGKSKAQ
ncbi:hypothetical protein FRC17_011228 [Serendipita sp. 399]|nr:hypothetical protein FRC17_011228 [Serendipita sp. 399]